MQMSVCLQEEQEKTKGIWKESDSDSNSSTTKRYVIPLLLLNKIANCTIKSTGRLL